MFQILAPRAWLRRPVTSPGAAEQAGVQSTGPVRCRTIEESDIDGVVALLQKGFADRPEAYWRRGLARHRARALPAGYPTFGYMLEHGGAPVGVLLTLYTAVPGEGGHAIRCNLSSWYVEPPFRAHGSLLEKIATRRPDVTYLNVTPAPHTWAIQEARRFHRYCLGQLLALPALSRCEPGVSVEEVTETTELGGLEPFERDLVRDHRSYGCVVLLGADRQGRRPFVLQSRTIGLIPNNPRIGQIGCMQLIHSPSTADFARFAGPIGRLLLRRHRMPWVVLDADGPIAGLVGRYFEGRAPKYFRGPGPVRLGDLAYTELVLFGP
jgi:hypothetical protein